MNPNNILNLLKLNLINTGNQTIYSLRQLKIFKKIIPNNIYNNKVIVSLFSVLGFIKSLLKEFAFDFTIIILTILMPLFMDSFSEKPSLYITELPVIIFLSIILTKIFKPTENKYNAVRMLRFNPKTYTTIEIIKNLIITTLIIIPFIIVLKISYPYEEYLILLILSNYIITYIFINLLLLYIYNKTRIIIHDSSKYFLLLLILFSLPLILNILNITISKYTFLIYTIILSIINIILIIWYTKTNTLIKLYKEKFSSYTNIIDEDKRISTNYEKRIKINSNIEINNNLKGYDRYNEIFIKRHKELLHDSIRTYSIIISILLIILIALPFIIPESNKVIKAFVNNDYLYIILIIYYTNRGQDTTKAMFYHCDQAMLKYNFYRKKETILNLFKLRIKSLIKLNLPITLILTIGIDTLYIITSSFNIINILLLSISTISTSIFFSIYYLSLYYLLQPFSSNMKIKNSKYVLIMIITYITIYELATEFNIHLIIATTSCSLISIICSILLILLIKTKSYKTFKLRNE